MASKLEAIAEENERRAISAQISHACGDLIKDFGRIDSDGSEDARVLVVPAARWGDDESELFYLTPLDEEGVMVSESAYVGYPEKIRHLLAVPRASIIYHPPQNGDAISVANILLNGGPDNTAVVTDFNDQPLTMPELEGLSKDLARYRSLLEEGRTEIPIQP